MKEYIKFGLVGLLSGVLVIISLNVMEMVRFNEPYILGIIFGLCIGLFMVVNPTTKISLIFFLKILVASGISYYCAFLVTVRNSNGSADILGTGEEFIFLLGGLTGAFILSLAFFRKSQLMFSKIAYFTLLGGVTAYVSTLPVIIDATNNIIGLKSVRDIDVYNNLLYLIWQTVMTLVIYHLFIRKERDLLV